MSVTQIAAKFGVKRSYVYGVAKTLIADLDRKARLILKENKMNQFKIDTKSNMFCSVFLSIYQDKFS